MKRVLITGVTGLVGDGICRYFLRNNWQVFGTSRRDLKSCHTNFYPLRFDLESKDDLNVLSKHSPYQVVVHNAAKLPQDSEHDNNGDNYYSCNVKGTRYLLQWAEESAINTFIYISSMGVVNSKETTETEESPLAPKPNNYHVSKAMGELLCQMYGTRGSLRTVILRISAPYGYAGINTAVIPKFIEWAKCDNDLELWGKGTRSQVFTFVEDIGYACELAVEQYASYGVYHIAGNESISMRELANKVLEAFPSSESRIVFSGAKDPKDGQAREISIAKAKRELGFEPQFKLSDGLNKIAENSERAFWHLTS
tara:strand:- start:3032 stop:3964 length:933 start_codon:yes stop_codon:yes gene_type:complete